MKSILTSILLAISLAVSCTPNIVIPKDFCVKYELSWDKATANIPEQIECVCTADLYTGLDAVLKELVSFPDKIEIIGVVAPSDCGVTKKPVVNEGDTEAKELLSR